MADRADLLVCPGGPLLVRGDLGVLDADGRVHRSPRPVAAVCRCGKSAAAPWCDGTHQVIAVRSDDDSMTKERP